MNRGRHKKQSFPYGEYVNMEVIYFNDHLKVQRRSVIYDYVKFEDKSSLNYKIIEWMTNKYYRILEIRIRYNQKIIRVYKRHEFYNKLYEQRLAQKTISLWQTCNILYILLYESLKKDITRNYHEIFETKEQFKQYDYNFQKRSNF